MCAQVITTGPDGRVYTDSCMTHLVGGEASPYVPTAQDFMSIKLFGVVPLWLVGAVALIWMFKK